MNCRTLLQVGLTSSFLVFAGTAIAMGPGGGNGKGGGACCEACADGAVNAAPVVELSAEASEGLEKMREEEKLARDVYAALGEKWDAQVFGITNSEQKHMDAMKKMLDRFDIADPVTDLTPGVYNSEEFDVLYDQLIEAGSGSLLDALKVGAKIEELDLVDLRIAIEGVEDPVLIKVYGNLMRATRNHLRAFAAQIDANGGTYEAEFLSQEEFDTIAASDIERGHGGQAKGQRQGQGQGKQGQAQRQGKGQGQGQGPGQGKGCGGGCNG